MKSKDKNSPASDQETNSPNCQSLPNGPISVMCIPPSLSDQEKTDKAKKDRRETIKFCVEVIGAFIVAGYLFFTILIWCANKKAADAADTAAKAAQDANKSLQAVQSALLIIDAPKVEFLPTPPKSDDLLYKITWTVENDGQTAAKDLTASLQSGGTGRFPPEEVDFVPNVGPTGETLAAGKSRTYETNGGEGDKAKIMTGEGHLVVALRISYRDIFGNPHVVAECSQYDFRTKTFRLCNFWRQSK